MASPQATCFKAGIGNLNHVSFWQRFRTIWTSRVLLSGHVSDNVYRSYQILNVSEDSDLDTVRESYLDLAKRYHPDSGSKLADTQKFSQLEKAYKTIVKHQQQQLATVQHEEEEMEASPSEINHIAAQHRQYLNNEGIGFGSPSTREEQYQKFRLMRASENVSNYRITKLSAPYENTMVVRDLAEAKKKKISNAIERVVEDLILESMSKGEFDNLPGKGKPLSYDSHNPMIDTATHNLNRILLENGYKPEWVLLEKEISKGIKEARENFFVARLTAGPEPITQSRKYIWKKNLAEFEERIDLINKQIHKYNMVVPSLQQQIVPYIVSKELQKVLHQYRTKLERGEIDSTPKQPVLINKPLDHNDIAGLKDVVNEIKRWFSFSLTKL